ncbi:hypothetical protein SPSIL_042920 [Sporomusa silvacetica DSM 10669]|uniref:HTH merR-type domain-containing protein n=1 Tax=Sporomusa silvacetica DSM 10669 TaxID=1123289 RepID=A0ABZ3IQT4_9FIRM|nr:hypothetical protein [Sporomusa silvacetica]OZC20553.1 hypothetical protein SPSIL_14210 [Sporomusa silvacetica DSM 10669]
MFTHNRIQELILQLNNLGYSSNQVNGMIKETIDATKWENLSLDEQKELIEGLEGYVNFAVKCRKAKL